METPYEQYEYWRIVRINALGAVAVADTNLDRITLIIRESEKDGIGHTEVVKWKS